MVLAVGKKAPNFALEDHAGVRHSLQSFGTERVVLYFYPKDDTPGCTLEAKEFSQHLKDFARQNVSVVGISGGDNRSKAKFCLKHKLSVPLLSDPDFSVSEAYGVYGQKKFMGRTFKGIHRTTFVINTSRGVVEQVFEQVKAEGHAADVLEALRRAPSQKSPSKVKDRKVSPKRAVTKRTAPHRNPTNKPSAKSGAGRSRRNVARRTRK